MTMNNGETVKETNVSVKNKTLLPLSNKKVQGKR